MELKKTEEKRREGSPFCGAVTQAQRGQKDGRKETELAGKAKKKGPMRWDFGAEMMDDGLDDE